METDAGASRYRSRILREMKANRENPFNSPPSSTGSHGTVSPTMSSVFSDPDGESTRKLNEDIARLTGQTGGKLEVDWKVAHNKWPEFFGMPTSANQAKARGAMPDHNKLSAALQTKESLASKHLARYLDESTQETWQDSKRTRAEMQPRVDDTDLSSNFTRSPKRPEIRLEPSQFAHQTRTRSPLARTYSNTRQPSAAEQQLKDQVDRFDHIRNAQALAATPKPASVKNMPSQHTPVDLNTIRNTFPSPATTDSPARNAPGATLNSFFMPDISHLNDLVSGNLRFNGSYKNGVPILVKHGKVRDQGAPHAAYDHAEVDGLAIPEEEENIFVSMDMIRKEIEDLQEHDDLVQKHALDLETELEQLRKEVKRLKSRSSVDSAIGSRTASEPETAAYERVVNEKLVLESQVVSLQTQLRQASRQAGANDEENNTLSLERDRALKKLQEACENIGELMDKLDSREKELTATQKKLDATLQMQANNSTSGQGNAASSRDQTAVDRENQALRADNAALRREKQSLQEELESLRSDNNSLRREYESLLSENRSLRSNARTLMSDNEELRQGSESSRRELTALREEVEVLQQDMEVMEQEKNTLKEDNDSLVRHNEKYFDENKLLRRENSGFERSINDLHDQNLRLSEEVEFLKQQLDHCRPLGKEDNFSVRLGHGDMEENEEGMTSAFFVPDITIDENSVIADATSESQMAPPDLETQNKSIEIPDTTGPTDMSIGDVEQILDSGRETTGKSRSQKQDGQTRDLTSQAQKVAFSLPDDTQNSKVNHNMANKGSKRRIQSTQKSSVKGAQFQHIDDSTILSPEVTQNMSVSLDLRGKVHPQPAAAPPQQRARAGSVTQDMTSQSRKAAKSSLKSTHQRSMTIDLTSGSRRETSVRETSARESSVRDPKSNCPGLSPDARRVLDGLCAHNCKNCVVCSRITAHRGAITMKEAAEGKKRVKVSKPVPVSEQYALHGPYTEEPTMRPSQHPGHALAMVIKGLEDEAAHMKMELSKLQAKYNDLNSALGRRDRKELASNLKEALRRLEVKNDQIYALYDVLEGQRQADQAMSEEELEMTVFSITGLSVRDATQNLTIDGVLV
ncbi:hypothetical protein B0T11DRAFT_249503 [Plectosphaerella cucumerina]|uniref:Uncharacterized protein n=1 Tax=Plectosphaerella cucumerina TaxID=40658 RepID=A0A8K0TUV6_9PEZI|nr:hypothetical protein B0T11DRAFT_249503 [Plectosphaerella cucumerina]